MAEPPPSKLDSHARALIRAGVQALPATFHEFLVVKGGPPEDEVHLLAVLRMLYVLTVIEAEGDEGLLRPLMSARSGILGLPDPDTPPWVPSGGHGAAYGQSYEGTAEERRPFDPYDAVSLADEAYDDVTGRWGSTPRPRDPNTGHTTIAENARFGGLTEQDEQYEREFEQLGDGASKWTWWVQWRRDYLDGKLPDRSIGTFIAQIDREDWEAGPDSVGRMIWQQLHAEAEAARQAAVDTLREVVGDRHGVGGNFPPPDQRLDDDTELADAAAAALEPLQELRFVNGPKPEDREKIRGGLSNLKGWLASFAKWSGKQALSAAEAALRSAMSRGIERAAEAFERLLSAIF